MYELAAGNLINIQVNYTNNMYEFNSKVQGNQEGILILSGAVLEGRRLRIPSDCKVNIVFQMLNKLYIWRDISVETISYKNRNYYRIKNTDIESKFYNRRGAYRLLIGDNKNISSDNDTNFAAIIHDISESGFSLISQNKLDINCNVSFDYSFAGKDFKLKGKVIRKSYDDTSNAYTYGCKLPAFYDELGSSIIKEQVNRRLKQHTA